MDTLEVGLKSNRSANSLTARRRKVVDHDADESSMFADWAWDNRPPDRISFVGLMQQLVINGKDFFETSDRDRKDQMVMTAVVDSTVHSVSFTTVSAYLVVTVKVLSEFVLYFRVSSALYCCHSGSFGGSTLLI